MIQRGYTAVHRMGSVLLTGVMSCGLLWGGAVYSAPLPCERVGLDRVISKAVDQDPLVLSGTINVVRPNITMVTQEELKYCLRHHRVCLLLIKSDYRAWIGRDNDENINIPWPKPKQAIPFIVMQYDKGEVNGQSLLQGFCAVLHQNLTNTNQWDVYLWHVGDKAITDETFVIEKKKDVSRFMQAAKDMIFKTKVGR